MNIRKKFKQYFLQDVLELIPPVRDSSISHFSCVRNALEVNRLLCRSEILGTRYLVLSQVLSLFHKFWKLRDNIMIGIITPDLKSSPLGQSNRNISWLAALAQNADRQNFHKARWRGRGLCN